MFRRILAWLGRRPGAVLSGERDTEEEEEEEERDARFVPSPLDRSVRDAHGGNDDLERELAAIADRAKEIEERGHED